MIGLVDVLALTGTILGAYYGPSLAPGHVWKVQSLPFLAQIPFPHVCPGPRFPAHCLWEPDATIVTADAPSQVGMAGLVHTYLTQRLHLRYVGFGKKIGLNIPPGEGGLTALGEPDHTPGSSAVEIKVCSLLHQADTLSCLYGHTWSFHCRQ